MRIDNVVFDLDGTLLDTSNGIIESVRHTIDVLRQPALSDNQLRAFIGPPLKKSFVKICGFSEVLADEAVRVFRAYYQEGAVLHATQYQGLTDLCEILISKDIKMGVATNKPNRFAVALIKQFGLDKYIKSVFGADEKGVLSKRDLIDLCMKDMNALRSNTVLIGDTDNDAIGAEQAGIQFIAVTYGFGFKAGEDIIEHPCVAMVDSPIQIADVISKCYAE